MTVESKPSALLLVLLVYVLCAYRLGLRAGAVAALLIALSVALHEAAHLVAATWFRVRVHAVGASFLGPYIRREPAESPSAEVVIAVAGPAVNFLLAVILSGAPQPFRFVALVNACLSLTNLVPRPGSDGRRAWRAFRKRTSETPSD